MNDLSKLRNNFSDIAESVFVDGFYICPERLLPEVVMDLKALLEKAVVDEKTFHRDDVDDPNQVVCCPFYDNRFLSALKGIVFNGANALLGCDCIIYSYGSSTVDPSADNFASKVHVERNDLSGDHLQAVGTMILLDDFSLKNGASWFLPGSHRFQDKPDDEFFFTHAKRVIEPAGTVLFFHPHIWHASGRNSSENSRSALALGFCKPYMKQRLDLVKVLSGCSAVFLDEEIRVKIGADSTPPSSIQEFYSRGPGW